MKLDLWKLVAKQQVRLWEPEEFTTMLGLIRDTVQILASNPQARSDDLESCARTGIENRAIFRSTLPISIA